MTIYDFTVGTQLREQPSAWYAKAGALSKADVEKEQKTWLIELKSNDCFRTQSGGSPYSD